MDDQTPKEDFVLMSEPLTPMLTMAVEAQRLLQAYLKAGFTRKESFDLVLNQMPEWTFPGQVIIEEDEDDDEDDDDLWEDVPDEMEDYD
jgi:hypothetical protein